MATFEKAFVMGYGSLDKFAEADGCLKIYESDSNYHVVRRPGDEEAILKSPYVKNPRLVWSKGAPAMPRQPQAHQQPAPAPTVAAPTWAPTHLVPAAGMAFWAVPDGRQPPVGLLSGNLELVLDASAGAWAQVRAVNGWRGWVDGRLLAAKALGQVGEDVTEPKGQTNVAKGVLGEIGVLFDIDGLGGGYYRYSALRVLFERLDPKRLAGCTVLDGDKSAASVVRMLADIVSKNGNLMLSVPLQRDGQPDADEIKIVSEIGAWLKVNGEAIYATRPWKIYGEGPSTQTSDKGQFDGQSDVSNKPFTSEDVRFTQSKNGKLLFAIVLEIPKDGKVTIKSLAAQSPHRLGKIGSVRLVGGGKVKFTRDESGLHVSLPEKFDGKIACALKIQS